jgi:pimeloyl-ACP methyl ester carboxylesterase
MATRGRVQRLLRYYRGRADQRLRLFYRRSFGDPGIALSAHMEGESRTLLLTFGGMRSMAGLASFEFVSMTRDMPVKRLFVRDPRQSWYHRGMPKHGSSLTSVADSLRDLLASHQVDRLVVVGTSAGGYAALVFGTLLGADTVLAFAPQTVLDPRLLAEMGDKRWDYLLTPVVRSGALEARWLDLRHALPGARYADTRYNVYFDENDPGDRAHAERLRGLDGFRLYRFGRGGHTLPRALRDCGALDRILRTALGVPVDESTDPGPPTSDFEQPGLEFHTLNASRTRDG